VKLALKSGALVPLVLMLPNFAWMWFYGSTTGPSASAASALSIAENVSRAVVLALPFFYSLNLKKVCSTLALVGMALALAVYYAAWARFFGGGGSAALLSAPLWGIPGPLALAPVVLLMCASYLMGSWWMCGAAAVFGALHVWSSALWAGGST
jgi:hypothetical protein